MMFKLQFSTDNAAFDNDRAGEIARILRDIADGSDIHWLTIGGGGNCPIRDANGNTIGTFSYRPE